MQVSTGRPNPELVRYRLLGAVSATDDEGNPIDLGPTKQRGLFAVLLLRANKTVTARELIDQVWGTDAPASAPKMVHMFVSRIRGALGPATSALLITRQRGYELHVEAGEFDLDQARACYAQGMACLDADPMRAANWFDQALELWNGDCLAELMELPFAPAAAADIGELRLQIEEAKSDAGLRAGLHSQVVGTLRRIAEAQPHRERPHAQLILALYRCGRQVEALAVFSRFRTDLAEWAGLEPSPALVDLQQRILNHDVSLALRDPPTTALTAPSSEPATSTRSHAARTAWIAALTVVIAAVAITMVSIRRGHHETGAVAAGVVVRPNSVVALDVVSGKILADVEVGSSPRAITTGSGSVWTANVQDRTITQVDGRSLRIVRTFGLPVTPTSLAAGPGVIWIGDGFDGTLSRILVQYEQLSAPFLPNPSAVGLSAVAVSADAVWVANAGHAIDELDPNSLRVLESLPALGRSQSIAVADGAVWVTGDGAKQVTRVPIAGPEAARVTTVVGTPRELIAGGGKIWTLSVAPNVLSEIDPVSDTVTATYRLSAAPTDLALCDDTVWIAEDTAHQLERIDPNASVVPTAFDIGHRVGGIACGNDRVWITADQ
jgi:DNA-binding SARP family transcriptional activator